jgi:hypothetical protein
MFPPYSAVEMLVPAAFGTWMKIDPVSRKQGWNT